MCDKIKEKDEKYIFSQTLVNFDGCNQQNQDLALCLKKADNDWRKCQSHTQELSKCIESAKKQHLH